MNILCCGPTLEPKSRKHPVYDFVSYSDILNVTELPADSLHRPHNPLSFSDMSNRAPLPVRVSNSTSSAATNTSTVRGNRSPESVQARPPAPPIPPRPTHSRRPFAPSSISVDARQNTGASSISLNGGRFRENMAIEIAELRFAASIHSNHIARLENFLVVEKQRIDRAMVEIQEAKANITRIHGDIAASRRWLHRHHTEIRNIEVGSTGRGGADGFSTRSGGADSGSTRSR
ncbi:hypothetical protein RUND412_004267 [Rhizina undulata]